MSGGVLHMQPHWGLLSCILNKNYERVHKIWLFKVILASVLLLPEMLVKYKIELATENLLKEIKIKKNKTKMVKKGKI
jgi:hypothetical protein